MSKKSKKSIKTKKRSAKATYTLTKATENSKLVAANAISDVTVDFQAFSHYNRNGINVSIHGLQSKHLSKVTRDSVVALFESNMKSLYQSSSWGYDSVAKYMELFEDAARYLLVYDQSDQVLSSLKPLVGFAHFRFVEDDGALVLYLYEVQLAARAQHCGLGKFIMQLLLLVARKQGMELMVLTVFKNNTGAMRFYRERLGFAIDETSPSACGDDSQDYEILSKSVV
ncbi:unnamed protein product [Peronospora belbahrii]|uniref:N-alpha-acetyltransferase 40 n=1 Tax=Peronospora belbahrii TaxID=622444 RepID=A0AAU9L0N7_9STRA|nr:unnamed protein product [Peronospora belbahrii]CAH0518529.1 unnamed protein product [Peronospora belbahrii]